MKINNNLIFEELSISNEVLQESQKIKDLIKQHLLTVEKEIRYSIYNPIYKVQHDLIQLEEKIFNVFNKIQINVKYFETQEDFIKMKDFFQFGGGISESNSILLLKIYGINDNLDESFLDSTLNHEMKHAFQIYMNKSFDVGELYKKAIEILQNEKKCNIPPILNNISNLLYFFNKNEIDANMETYYQDLLHNNKNSSLLDDFEMSVKSFDDIKDFILDDKACEIVKNAFGKPLKQIINYLNNNIEYFKTKKRKVFARYSNEKRISENYSQKFNKFLI